MNANPTRRLFLRSSTAMIALPPLESFGFRRFASAAPAATPPKRMIFLSFGYGVTESSWYPDVTKTGPDYKLSPGLEPLAKHKADFTVIQGLTNKFANEGHWGSTLWLTGANRYAEPGQSFHNSISADQVAAGHLGQETRFPSIQLNGGPATEMGGSGHGPGLSLAWDVRGKPIGGFDTPVDAYHRLFSTDKTPIGQQKAMLAQRRSVLDTVRENAREMQQQLSKKDNDKLNEYFEGIRDIETRLGKEERWIGVPQPKTAMPEPKPGMVGREEIRLMYDLMVAAFQTDSTRVFTFRQPVKSLLPSIDVKVHPHDMSHYHAVLGEKLDASQRRDAAQSELLAGLIGKLKATKEADGSRLFDHTCLVYGSNLRTGHSLDNCPTVVAGGGAGIKLGHHIVAPKNTPLCNLWLTLLHGVGAKVERHGDSTGLLKEVIA
ncbi:MAG: hypothetical protein C0467_14850 [Planctomycetaceae bacterium]|nr:hypothetical protein [Planctomycetaceae bacterium]